MKLSKHIKPINIRVILFYLAGALELFGVTLIMPFIVSLLAGEYTYSVIFGSLSLGTAGIGFAVRKLWNQTTQLEIIDALAVTALAYLLFGIIGAIPFLPVASFIDSFFEAMSGFTTTGLTLMDVTTLPITLHFFRAYSQWLGGMGIIILSLAVLLRSGTAAFKLYASEFGEKNIVGSVVATAKVVIRVYLILTVVGFVAFLLAGMGPFDGLIHILTTIPTGGFSLYADSIGHYNSAFISLTVTVFMVLGAISFPLYYVLAKDGVREFLKDNQLRTLLLLLVLGSALFVVEFGSSLNSVVHGVFQTATAITTTGYNIVPTTPLSEVSKVITTLFMIIGGSTGSTAGGIKIFRLLILLGFVRVLFFGPILPKGAEIPIGLGGMKITKKEAELIAAFFLTYLIILIVSTLSVMWIEGTGFTDTLFEIASAEGTVGMSVGVTSPVLSVWSKLILTLNMWIGRLEILPVLVVLNPGIWIKKWQLFRKKKEGQGERSEEKTIIKSRGNV